MWKLRFEIRDSLIALMMEAARTSETLVNFYQTTRRYNPEDSHLRFTNVFEHFWATVISAHLEICVA
jgi:hypothetical protein